MRVIVDSLCRNTDWNMDVTQALKMNQSSPFPPISAPHIKVCLRVKKSNNLKEIYFIPIAGINYL